MTSEIYRKYYHFKAEILFYQLAIFILIFVIYFTSYPKSSHIFWSTLVQTMYLDRYTVCQSRYELRHDKSNKMAVRPAKTQLSLGIHPVWSESSLSAWRNLGSLATGWAYSKDSDQTGRMPRLIWVFAGCTVILLVLSWDVSYVYVCRLIYMLDVSQLTQFIKQHTWCVCHATFNYYTYIDCNTVRQSAFVSN